jgi:hypothetical protein
VSGSAFGAATFTILNGDGPGEGFNDPTPVAPVGGNTGTTLGQQRLIALQHAATLWGAQLDSTVVIDVLATVDPLTCTATAGTLAAAGANTVWSDSPNIPRLSTWYGAALANKYAGFDLYTVTDDPDPENHTDIRVFVNSNLGQASCLGGTPFYLGLDNNHGTAVDLVAVLLHELAHGLGFQTYTSTATGAQIDAGTGGLPSIYDYFLRDNTTGKTWDVMTNAERVASAINTRQLAWIGANVTAAASTVLSPGTPELRVTAPASKAGTYLVGTAAFGPPLSAGSVSGEVMPPADALACVPFGPLDAAAVNGRIALVDRGTCTFAVKVKNAQDAGAIGVLVANNAAGSPPPALGGADPTITIPSVMISQADANSLKSVLRFRSRLRSGMFATLGVNSLVLAGADPAGNLLVFTPNPRQAGSTVSHWDSIAFPNLLMEPAINADLTHSVVPPQDLTRPMLRDLGWIP